MAKLSKHNWDLPPDKKIDMVADMILYSAPLLSGVIMGLPLSETLTAWLIFPWTLITALAKILAKFSKEYYHEDTN